MPLFATQLAMRVVGSQAGSVLTSPNLIFAAGGSAKTTCTPDATSACNNLKDPIWWSCNFTAIQPLVTGATFEVDGYAVIDAPSPAPPSPSPPFPAPPSPAPPSPSPPSPAQPSPAPPSPSPPSPAQPSPAPPSPSPPSPAQPSPAPHSSPSPTPATGGPRSPGEGPSPAPTPYNQPSPTDDKPSRSPPLPGMSSSPSPRPGPGPSASRPPSPPPRFLPSPRRPPSLPRPPPAPAPDPATGMLAVTRELVVRDTGAVSPQEAAAALVAMLPGAERVTPVQYDVRVMLEAAAASGTGSSLAVCSDALIAALRTALRGSASSGGMQAAMQSADVACSQAVATVTSGTGSGIRSDPRRTLQQTAGDSNTTATTPTATCAPGTGTPIELAFEVPALNSSRSSSPTPAAANGSVPTATTTIATDAVEAAATVDALKSQVFGAVTAAAAASGGAVGDVSLCGGTGGLTSAADVKVDTVVRASYRVALSSKGAETYAAACSLSSSGSGSGAGAIDATSVAALAALSLCPDCTACAVLPVPLKEGGPDRSGSSNSSPPPIGTSGIPQGADGSGGSGGSNSSAGIIIAVVAAVAGSLAVAAAAAAVVVVRRRRRQKRHPFEGKAGLGGSVDLGSGNCDDGEAAPAIVEVESFDDVDRDSDGNARPAQEGPPPDQPLKRSYVDLAPFGAAAAAAAAYGHRNSGRDLLHRIRTSPGRGGARTSPSRGGAATPASCASEATGREARSSGSGTAVAADADGGAAPGDEDGVVTIPAGGLGSARLSLLQGRTGSQRQLLAQRYSTGGMLREPAMGGAPGGGGAIAGLGAATATASGAVAAGVAQGRQRGRALLLMQAARAHKSMGSGAGHFAGGTGGGPRSSWRGRAANRKVTDSGTSGYSSGPAAGVGVADEESPFGTPRSSVAGPGLHSGPTSVPSVLTNGRRKWLSDADVAVAGAGAGATAGYSVLSIDRFTRHSAHDGYIGGTGGGSTPSSPGRRRVTFAEGSVGPGAGAGAGVSPGAVVGCADAAAVAAAAAAGEAAVMAGGSTEVVRLHPYSSELVLEQVEGVACATGGPGHGSRTGSGAVMAPSASAAALADLPSALPHNGSLPGASAAHAAAAASIAAALPGCVCSPTKSRAEEAAAAAAAAEAAAAAAGIEVVAHRASLVYLDAPGPCSAPAALEGGSDTFCMGGIAGAGPAAAGGSGGRLTSRYVNSSTFSACPPGAVNGDGNSSGGSSSGGSAGAPEVTLSGGASYVAAVSAAINALGGGGGGGGSQPASSAGVPTRVNSPDLLGAAAATAAGTANATGPVYSSSLLPVPPPRWDSVLLRKHLSSSRRNLSPLRPQTPTEPQPLEIAAAGRLAYAPLPPMPASTSGVLYQPSAGAAASPDLAALELGPAASLRTPQLSMRHSINGVTPEPLGSGVGHSCGSSAGGGGTGIRPRVAPIGGSSGSNTGSSVPELLIPAGSGGYSSSSGDGVIDAKLMAASMSVPGAGAGAGAGGGGSPGSHAQLAAHMLGSSLTSPVRSTEVTVAAATAAAAAVAAALRDACSSPRQLPIIAEEAD
ncbi:hypothetical protein HYH02_001382 [Chlamydomonas schloesseri]|uniref:Uncharacterized protein n=1 Tax=Chlamydomonas schloesseri TaxID=2026947 RepID=A0A836BCL3_9CHLO|nr:hypothetical protein HYH02_001382 [Chlamydomonas schloesseri]|eukprot:KAG2454358.1 hypothetical protein HYH02_001382 [Chlamydomonas schloesseri]